MSWQTTAAPDCVALDRPAAGGGDEDRINCYAASCSFPVVCISEIPFNNTSGFNYLEVTLLEGSSLILGLVGEFHDNDGGGIPGKRANSIGLFSNGDLLCNVPGSECTLPFSSPFGQLDTVGIGIEYSTNTFQVRAFCTHNGRDLGTILTTHSSTCPLFPVIAFEDSFVIVTVKKQGPFLFTRNMKPLAKPHSTNNMARNRSMSSEQWHTAVKTAGSAVGRKLTQFFTPPPATSASASQSLEEDLMETQEHINLLAGVLTQQDEAAQRELLLELTVSCRRLLVRHQNLIREASDDASLKKILAMNDHIVDLLLSADKILDNGNNSTSLIKVVSPTSSSFACDSLMERGTSLKVIEMLHMLRSGTPRAQRNAATSLAVFVKEELSRDLIIVNGGVHYLVVMSNRREDAELSMLATKALCELTSRIRMRKDQESECTFYIVRSVFKAELSGMLKAFEARMLFHQDVESMLLIAQAVANLIMLSVINKPMDELGVSILLRILEHNTHALETRRVAAFAVSLLVRKIPASRSSIVSQFRFFTILEDLLRAEDGELQLYAVGCLAGLIVESGGNGEEDRFAQGFITARVLHSKHHVLSCLIALCNSADDGDDLVQSYSIQCLHATVLHPSGLLALLDEVSAQSLVDTLLKLVGGLMNNKKKKKENSAVVVMDESSFFYSSRFQDTFNACELKTRRQMLATTENEFSPVQFIVHVLHQVLCVVTEICFTEEQIQVIDLLTKDEHAQAVAVVELVTLLCLKFEVGASLFCTTLVDLIRSGRTQLRAVESVAALCDDANIAPKIFGLNFATHLCNLQSSADGELDLHVAAALLGLAKVCFTSAQGGLFGFEPEGPVLDFLLQAVEHFDLDPRVAASSCKVLALAIRGGRGALSVHYRAAVLKQIAFQTSQMSSRCVLDCGRRAADELLQACGFSFGALQLVANEPLAIQEWASLKVDLEIYQAILDYAMQLLHSPHDGGGGEMVRGFYDPMVNERHHHLLRASKSKQRTSDLKQVATNVVSGLKQSPPSKWIQVVATNLGHAQTISREVLGSEIKIAKRLFHRLVSNNNSSADPLVFDLYSICFDLFDLQQRGGEDEIMLPASIQELFDHVYLNIGPLELYLHLFHQDGLLSAHYLRSGRGRRKSRLIRLNQRIHVWSLPLVTTVIDEDEEEVKFTLVLGTSDLLVGTDEKTQLVELLDATPALTSLCLVGNGGNGVINRQVEERIAQLSANLPSTLTWLTLDRNALSAEGLRLLCAFLGVKCTLHGLAVTNTTYNADEFADLIRFVSNSQIECLDLSSNCNLQDVHWARICKSLTQNQQLVALDLSGNRLGHATIDVLLGGGNRSVEASPDVLLREIRGEAKVHADGLLRQLELLSLARCSLTADCAARIFYALSKNGSELRVFDLDGNALPSKLLRPLVSFLAFNKSVRELGFAQNDSFSGEVNDVIQAVRYNTTLQYFRNEFPVSAFEQSIAPVLHMNRNAAIRAAKQQDSPAAAQRPNNNNEEEEARLQVLFSSPLVFRNAFGELTPLDGLDCDSEKQLLLNSFEEARSLSTNCRIDINFEFGCTTDKLISVLTRKPTSLHLSTHGEKTFIVLEDGRGGMHAVSTVQLREICEIAQVDKFLKLVFVSACSSSTFVAQAFVSAGVSNVVGVNAMISDRAAQVFTRAFYLSLALGDPVKLAFQIARQSVRTSPACHLFPGEEDKFVLLGSGEETVFPKPTLKQSSVAMSSNSMRRLMPDSAGIASSTVFPNPNKWRLTQSKFLEVIVPGRRIDVYLAVVALSCKRIVTVVAPEGYGKSATIAGFLCKFLNDRLVFNDGAVVLDLSSCRDIADVHSKLIRFVRIFSASATGSGNGVAFMHSNSNGTLEHTEDELERTLQELAKRRCLLLMDHVDAVLDTCFEEFRFFLGQVLDRTKVRVLITTRNEHSLAVPGYEHLVHTLGPLNGVDSSMLFLRNCPHYYNDLHRRDAAPPLNFELGLAKHPIIAALRGVPKNIVTAASVISYDEWETVVEEVVEALLPTINNNNV